jgi:tetratricopeptide (TPR) repeat protein
VIVRLGGLASTTERVAGGCALALVALVCAGCPIPQIKSEATVTSQSLPEKVPDLIKYADAIAAKPDWQPAEMENALLALDKATKADPKNFEAAWKAARAALWLADQYYDDKTKRAHFAGVGAEYAKQAINLEPKRVEGHYYSGMNLGLTATTKTIGAKFMVPSVRDAEKKAMAIDSCYDHGGPPRVLGSLYAEAPPWPASIGDPDKGVDLIQQALKCGPDWPLNNLLLANALVKAERYDDAKKQYQIVLDAQPRPEDQHFLPEWQQRAKKGLEDADKKKQAALSGSS